MADTNRLMQRGIWAWLGLGTVLAAWIGGPTATEGENRQRLYQTLRRPWELNTADSAALVVVRGIGPAAAARILRNRYWAGPFPSVDSLRRVQGLRTLGYMSALRRHLWVHPDTVYRLHLRRLASGGPRFRVATDDWQTLVAAGLLPGWAATSLTKRRERTGTILYPEEVAGRSQRDAVWLRKLHPILSYPATRGLDLNLATVEELRRVPGLNKGLASRIVNYRTRLGFYTHALQLREIAGVEPERWQQALKYFYVGPPPREAIYLPLNTDSTKHWSRHPYLTAEHARALRSVARDYGPYQTIAGWRLALPDSVWRKVAPYVR